MSIKDHDTADNSSQFQEHNSNKPKSISDEFGFRYREIKSQMTQEEQLAYTNVVAYNALFFQLEGEMLIRWDGHHEITVKAGEMYFLPRGANINACILGDHISYVVVRLEHNLSSYKAFSSLDKIKERKDFDSYHFAPLAINGSMMRFAESVKDYLLRKIDSPQLYDIKLSEMQYIFSWCYSPLECARLLYPFVPYNSEFEQFVLNNYNSLTSIEELVAKANMSRSTFDRKFKDTFKTTPLKWIDKQIRHKIIHKASEPNVTVKDLMYEVGVYNPSQFTKLCRRLCGVIPSELIHLR